MPYRRISRDISAVDVSLLLWNSSDQSSNYPFSANTSNPPGTIDDSSSR